MKKIFYNSYGEDNPELSSDTKYVWPKKGHRLLRPPTESTPKEVSAHLDWLKIFNSEDLGMPEAYKQGGDYLVEALKQGGDRSHPDRFVFPILYFYRHATELRLKQIIRLGIKLDMLQPSDKLDEIQKDHALYPLWNSARGIFEAYWPKGDKSELSAAETMIQELHQTDRDGQHLQ